MADQEIRETILRIKQLIVCGQVRFGDDEPKIECLITLAEKYLACSGMMPRKEICEVDGIRIECKKCSQEIHFDGADCDTKIRNRTIDECTLAITKRIEGLREVIEKFDKDLYYDFETEYYSIEEFVDEIRRHLLGKEGK